MTIKINLNELIKMVVNTTVEHYVRKTEDSMRYDHREIRDESIDNMKNSLIRKLSAIFEENEEE